MCYTHGGAAPQVKAKARERLRALAPKGVQVLDELLDRAEFPTVQFQAARYVTEVEWGKPVEHVQSEVKMSLAALLADPQPAPIEAKALPAGESEPESTKEK